MDFMIAFDSHELHWESKENVSRTVGAVTVLLVALCFLDFAIQRVYAALGELRAKVQKKKELTCRTREDYRSSNIDCPAVLKPRNVTWEKKSNKCPTTALMRIPRRVERIALPSSVYAKASNIPNTKGNAKKPNRAIDENESTQMPVKKSKSAEMPSKNIEVSRTQWLSVGDVLSTNAEECLLFENIDEVTEAGGSSLVTNKNVFIKPPTPEARIANISVSAPSFSHHFDSKSTQTLPGYNAYIKCLTKKSTQTLSLPGYNAYIKCLTKQVKDFTKDIVNQSLLNLFSGKMTTQNGDATNLHHFKKRKSHIGHKRDHSFETLSRVRSFLPIELTIRMKSPKKLDERKDPMPSHLECEKGLQRSYLKQLARELVRIKSVTPISLEVGRERAQSDFGQISRKTKRPHSKNRVFDGLKTSSEKQAYQGQNTNVRNRSCQISSLGNQGGKIPESSSANRKQANEDVCRRDFNSYSLPREDNDAPECGGYGDHEMEARTAVHSATMRHQCFPLDGSDIGQKFGRIKKDTSRTFSAKMDARRSALICESKQIIFDRVVQELQSQLSNSVQRRGLFIKEAKSGHKWKGRSGNTTPLTDLYRNLKSIEETEESAMSLAMSLRNIHLIEDLRRHGVSCALNRSSSTNMKPSICQRRLCHQPSRHEQSVPKVEERNPPTEALTEGKQGEVFHANTPLLEQGEIIHVNTPFKIVAVTKRQPKVNGFFRRKCKRKKMVGRTGDILKQLRRANYCLVPMCKCVEGFRVPTSHLARSDSSSSSKDTCTDEDGESVTCL